MGSFRAKLNEMEPTWVVENVGAHQRRAGQRVQHGADLQQESNVSWSLLRHMRTHLHGEHEAETGSWWHHAAHGHRDRAGVHLEHTAPRVSRGNRESGKDLRLTRGRASAGTGPKALQGVRAGVAGGPMATACTVARTANASSSRTSPPSVLRSITDPIQHKGK